MLKMRLQRTGRKNDASFRVVVTDSRRGPKSGKHVDLLGSYNPKMNHIQIDGEKAKKWIANGTQVSPTVHNLLITQKIIEGKKINVLPRKSPIVDEAAVKAAEEAKEAEAAAKAEAEAAPAEEAVEAPAEEAKAEEVAEEAAPEAEAPAAEEEKAEEPAPAEEAKAEEVAEEAPKAEEEASAVEEAPAEETEEKKAD